MLQHKTFYKTFGRPIAKVFLMAIFTYQVAYYFWVRLEQDEIRGEMEGMFFFFPRAFFPLLITPRGLVQIPIQKFTTD